MKKIFLIICLMILTSGLASATVTSAENPDRNFTDTVQYNLKKSDGSTFVSYSVSYEGKIGDISIITPSSSEEYNNNVIETMKNTVQSYSNQIDNLINTKKYWGNQYTRFAVNIYEKNKISNGEIEKMAINKKNFYTANISSYKPSIIYNSNKSENSYLEKYIETLNNEEKKITETLPKWNSFNTKTIFAYVKLDRNGKVTDSKILQSCGSTAYDEQYLDKIKNHTFTAPDENISDNDLNFIFSIKPLKSEKYNALNNYRRSVERTLYYATPYSHNLKPTTIVAEVTVLKNGTLKNVKLLEPTYSTTYDEKIIKAYKKTLYKAFPPEINAAELTFVVRLRKNTQYYPQIDDRNYTSLVLLD